MVVPSPPPPPPPPSKQTCFLRCLRSIKGFQSQWIICVISLFYFSLSFESSERWIMIFNAGKECVKKKAFFVSFLRASCRLCIFLGWFSWDAGNNNRQLTFLWGGEEKRRLVSKRGKKPLGGGGGVLINFLRYMGKKMLLLCGQKGGGTQASYVRYLTPIPLKRKRERAAIYIPQLGAGNSEVFCWSKKKRISAQNGGQNG